MNDVPGPASSRIAAEIRGQIQSGELAAGERVPSTREIIGVGVLPWRQPPRCWRL